MPILYDNSNYIHCFIKKIEELNKKQKDLELLIKDSNIELVIFRDDNDLNKIKCLLLLIVNNYSILNKEEAEKFEQVEEILDVNNDERINDKLKLFLFDYIKENKDKEELNKILLNDSSNNIRFFNNKEYKDFIDEIKKIKTCENAYEINNDNKKSINEILDEINPSYKEELMDKYNDEMPEEIVELMKKYKNVNFTNEMYINYINYKNKPEDVKENNKENKEENNNINSPIKENEFTTEEEKIDILDRFKDALAFVKEPKKRADKLLKAIYLANIVKIEYKLFLLSLIQLLHCTISQSFLLHLQVYFYN